MTEQGYREQAIQDVDDMFNNGPFYEEAEPYLWKIARSQRERVLRLEDALREVARGSQLSMDVPKWRLSEEVCDLIRAALAIKEGQL